MSQQPNSSSPVNDAVGAFFMLVVLIAMAVFFVLAFVAFTLTLLALCAWSSPLTLGPLRIEPAQARAFVRRGLFVGGSSLMFVTLCSVLLDFALEWQAVWITFAIGYSLGSVGIEAFSMAFAGAKSHASTARASQKSVAPWQTTTALPPSETRPHRFATWDDEEARGK